MKLSTEELVRANIIASKELLSGEKTGRGIRLVPGPTQKLQCKDYVLQVSQWHPRLKVLTYHNLYDVLTSLSANEPPPEDM